MSELSAYLCSPAQPAACFLGPSSSSDDGDDKSSDTDERDWGDADLDEDLVAGQMDGDGLGDDGEEEGEAQQQQELQLPEEVWVELLHRASVRDVCVLARVNRWLRELSLHPQLWRQKYVQLFGEEPPGAGGAAAVRRLCRRSELKAARWLEAEVKVMLMTRGGRESDHDLRVGHRAR